MVTVNEILDRSFKAAGFTPEQVELINSAITVDSEKAKIDGEAGKEILSKSQSITSESYILNDPKTKDRVFQQAQSELMPGIEKATAKVLKDVFGTEALPEEKIAAIWGDEKNKTINNKVYHAGLAVKEFFGNQIKQTKTDSPELLQQLKDLQGIVKSTNEQLELEKANSQKAVSQVEQKYENEAISRMLVNKAKKAGADIEGMEEGFAYQLMSKYGWRRNGKKLEAFQKGNPELLVIDEQSKTTLNADQILAREIAPRLDRSGKTQQRTGKPPKHEPGKDSDRIETKNPFPEGSASWKRQERVLELERARAKR